MDSVLVTGGAGFIGGNFARHFSKRENTRVVILDKLTYAASLSSIEDVLQKDNVTFMKGDIGNTELVEYIFDKYAINAVINFAAESHVDRSILGPEEFINTNIKGTFNLLEVARARWSSDYTNKRFLHVSTDEVYGTLAKDDPPFDEETSFKPNSPYSASKAASDHLARAWHHTYGMPVIITNCSNNYGPWQFPEKLVPLMILNVIEKKPLPIYGDGQQIRDWLHVNDHCSAIERVYESGVDGETYCIGGNNERANIDIVHAIIDSVDKKLGNPEGHSRSLITHVQDRPGHDRRYAINSGKLKEKLNWEPSYTFEEAIEEIVTWYLDNGDWVDGIRSGEYTNFYQQQYGHRIEE